MGITTITQEFPIPKLPSGSAPPPPSERPQAKAFTHGVDSIELVEGQWDVPGSIFKVTNSDGGYEKYKIAVSDQANKCYKNTLVEGGLVGDKVESADLEIAFTGDSNPVMKISTSYHTKGDLKLTEEEICAEKNKAMLICQAMVAEFSKPTNAS